MSSTSCSAGEFDLIFARASLHNVMHLSAISPYLPRISQAELKAELRKLSLRWDMVGSGVGVG